MLNMHRFTLREYVESHDLQMIEYTRRQWCYIKITGDLRKTPSWMINPDGSPNFKMWLSRARVTYPNAKLVRAESAVLVFNIGTVFDLINPPHNEQEPELALSILRSTMPALIAQQIVGVQPLLTSTNLFGNIKSK